MKKILIAVLTVVALACCFSACNNKPSGNPSAEINPLEFASETLSIEMFKEMQLDYDVKGVITEEIKIDGILCPGFIDQHIHGAGGAGHRLPLCAGHQHSAQLLCRHRRRHDGHVYGHHCGGAVQVHPDL